MLATIADAILTPAMLRAVAGGLLIGLAAGIFLLVNGRILGISGLSAALVGRWPPPKLSPALVENLLLLAGLPLGAGLFILLVEPLAPSIAPALAPLWRLAVAGLLVGFGARMANGCTSGHAVCGLARCSKRSITATVTFMLVAAAVVALIGRP